MADDRWLTFDCYGTIADWNTCMREALEPAVGAAAPALLTAYHQAELTLEAGPSWRPYREILSSGLRWAALRLELPLEAGQADALVDAWPRMTIFEDAGGALGALAAAGWRLAILTNCDEDLFATTLPKLPVQFDLVVTAEQVRSYKPDLAHFRKFAELTGATRANWIHVANSWVHDILPAARMGLRSVWVDRDLTGHPAKLAERRITAMRRLPETVADVSAVPPWPPLDLGGQRGHGQRGHGLSGPVKALASLPQLAAALMPPLAVASDPTLVAVGLGLGLGLGLDLGLGDAVAAVGRAGTVARAGIAARARL